VGGLDSTALDFAFGAGVEAFTLDFVLRLGAEA
jgi:hypothetical protein